MPPAITPAPSASLPDATQRDVDRARSSIAHPDKSPVRNADSGGAVDGHTMNTPLPLPLPSPLPPITASSESVLRAKVAQLERTVERLTSEKFALERRVERARLDFDQLQSNNHTLTLRADRAESFRAERDEARNEITRLRIEARETAREMARLRDSVASAANAATDRATLERVIMGVRKRCALAEKENECIADLREQLADKRHLEKRLIDARIECERLRASASRTRHNLSSNHRTKHAVNNDDRTHQTRAHTLSRATRARSMDRKSRSNRDREGGTHSSALNQPIPSRRPSRRRAATVSTSSSTSSSTTGRHSSDALLTAVNGAERSDQMEDDDRSQALNDDNRQLESSQLSGTSDDGNDDDEDYDDDSNATQSLSLSMTHSESTGTSRSRATIEASPLLREVQATQAELDAVFRTPGNHNSSATTAHRNAADDVDGDELMERVRQLEATFAPHVPN